MNLILAAATAAAKAAPAAAKLAAPKATALPLQVNPQVQTQALAPQHFTWFQSHAGWLTHGIAGIFMVSAVGLIVLLAAQTTKQEGLSGTIGGRVESAYGRPGAEEQLKRLTGFAATCFVVCSTILALTGI